MAIRNRNILECNPMKFVSEICSISMILDLNLWVLTKPLIWKILRLALILTCYFRILNVAYSKTNEWYDGINPNLISLRLDLLSFEMVKLLLLHFHRICMVINKAVKMQLCKSIFRTISGFEISRVFSLIIIGHQRFSISSSHIRQPFNNSFSKLIWKQN